MIEIILTLVLLIILLVLVNQKVNNEDLVSFFCNYKLEQDPNYLKSLNQAILDIIGEEQYKKMCTLNTYFNLISFSLPASGNPAVLITINYLNQSEKVQLEMILKNITSNFLSNYKLPDLAVNSYWDTNTTIGYPMLVIMYSRNRTESNMLQLQLKDKAKKIISSSEVIDDSEDLL